MENMARGKLSSADANHTAFYYFRLLGIPENEALALSEKELPQINRIPRSS